MRRLETQPTCVNAASVFFIVQMELAISTPLSQPSDQNPIDTNEVYSCG